MLHNGMSTYFVDFLRQYRPDIIIRQYFMQNLICVIIANINLRCHVIDVLFLTLLVGEIKHRASQSKGIS